MPLVSPTRLIFAVGHRIADLRRGRGLTQAELADEIGVSTKYLQRVEAGEENLTLRSLARLASALRVQVAEFFATPMRRRARRGRPRATPAG